MNLVRQLSGSITPRGQKTIAPPPSGNAGMKRQGSITTVKDDLRGAHDQMQLKTFTRWWNSWLSPRGVDVTNLCEQIKPGIIGINLMEALSGQPSGRYNKSVKNAYQAGENQIIFLNSIKSKGLKLVNIGPDDLQAGDQKLVLGLTCAPAPGIFSHTSNKIAVF